MSTARYTFAIGRRKTAVAEVRLRTGKGDSTINGKPVDVFVKRADLFSLIYAPLKVAGVFDTYHFDIEVSGSWESAQAQAIRHGLSRALVKSDENVKKMLKGAGFLTRDSRQVERKKPWFHKARKSPSWSKR